MYAIGLVLLLVVSATAAKGPDFAIPTKDVIPPTVAVTTTTHINGVAPPTLTTTPPTKLTGLGLQPNTRGASYIKGKEPNFNMPKKPSDENLLMSSQTTPGLPVWQQGPQFVPITPA